MIKETNLMHQGNKVFLKLTETRTCKDCIYSSQGKGVMCHKPFGSPKCIVDNKDYIFTLIEKD